MTDIVPSQMTTTEKLKVMEQLWDDLCANQQILSPDWHQSVLAHRHQQRHNNLQPPVEWSQAKTNIRQQLL